MPATIDLNCDMGESFGRYSLGEDEAVMAAITSANVACGLHAGDPLVIDRTVAPSAQRRASVAGPAFTTCGALRRLHAGRGASK